MNDKTKLKIENLIALRQLLTNTLTVLIGGTVGLLFVPDSIAKFVLICVGLFYICLFITNLSNAIVELNTLINKEDDNA